VKKSIEGLTDSEIVDFLNQYNKGVENKILDFENADQLFSELYKRSQIELVNRLGSLTELE
jgi:hypothetical protein